MRLPVPYIRGSVTVGFLLKGPQVELGTTATYKNNECGGPVMLRKVCVPLAYSPEMSGSLALGLFGEASISADADIRLEGCAEPSFDQNGDITKVTYTLNSCYTYKGAQVEVYVGPRRVYQRWIDKPSRRECSEWWRKVHRF